ncbi:MAG TPA: hypothetical protein VLI39_12875 [Sedimentisphaerales bacterium]|nr:hypothetical protein [Sedimentisphaerales bacterium]
MTEHRSFRISDFSIRDIPWAVAAYVILSLLSIGVGVFLESLREFWSGFLFGAGLVLMGALFLFGPRTRRIDVAALPQPSEKIRAKWDDPNCSLVEAVKAYREDTGCGLAEAKAVVDSYRASKQRPAKNDTTP